MEILSKSTDKRTIHDLLILEKIVENITFFQKILLKYRPLALKLLRQLKLKTLKRGKTLFFAGDLPDNFYIILKGSVFILIPKDADLMKDERNEDTEKIKQFLLRYRTEKACSPFLASKGMAIRRISIGLLRSKSSSEIDEPLKGNMSHYYRKEMSVDFELKDFDKPWLYFDEGVFKYNCINVLNSGQSFGELGLLIRKPRNATILCKEDIQLLYLEKQDYMLLEQIDRQKILRKLAFFSEFFFRDTVNNDYVLRMIYNFQKKKYGYGKILFNENDSIDGCYVIKKGRILIKKHIIFENNENNKESKEVQGIEKCLRVHERKNKSIEEISSDIEVMKKNYLYLFY